MSTIISEKNKKGLLKDNPFISRLLSRRLLSKENSTKAVYLLTLDLEKFKNSFSEGDAFAIFPKNSSLIIEQIVNHLGAKPNELILPNKSETKIPFQVFLERQANLAKVSSKLLREVAPLASKEKAILNQLLNGPKETLKTFLNSHDLLSLLDFCQPKGLEPQQLAAHLLPSTPRFYSCCSSYAQSQTTIDFLIATFEYEIHGSKRHGLGSDYLCHRALDDEDILVYLQKNCRFQLPLDPKTPIIMIGPGTGVAPFRAFMQKRFLQKAKKNWLFFGERQQACDFYFEEEWKSLEKDGFLSLSCAFSRDHQGKIYVQDKILEHSKRLMEWINLGAIIYVCGDAKHMEKGVRKALIEVLKKERQLDEENAKETFKSLQKEKRYLADCY